ncbi:hypothetical protein BDV98DRAFT_229793 [Pterulicium gracile]|uniref:protein S-acyltransferase n=1 Tax=Pterulicium gracile TaxID=1884261 RepID=A0A5C3QZG1_9AGAR|nr:hypothetical protein BDV98DRAFT_229793 [Pterula gracilis]
MSSAAHLTTIAESGLSDTQMSTPSSEPSSPTEFTYPGTSTNTEEEEAAHESDDEDQFVYPGAEDKDTVNELQPVVSSEAPQVQQPPASPHPSPAQLESLYAAASSGDLPQLKRLFNSALDIGDCGAIPDLEDKEGETCLHKASLNGHLSILQYLLPDRADVHCRDADGWTALHNACSKGYLDIVRWLCEEALATSDVDGVPGVDVRSKGGWTPLMNAGSKGHLPVVLYLLTKVGANPLVRNNWGETAYDIAAAVFEVWICEVLQKAESGRWRGTTVPYNPLAVHTTVPLIVYEYQRLDMRLKSLALSGGHPTFSAAGLGKQGRHPPFEMKLPKPDEDTRRSTVPAFRSQVQLPARDSPWELPLPGATGTSVEGSERSHFWLSDWTLDITQPGVDPEEGWQYSQSFTEPDNSWVGEEPPQLQRLLSGSGAVAANLAGAGSARPRVGDRRTSASSTRSTQAWVRRRRWVRVLRRRLDIEALPFLQPDGNLYHLDADGTMVPYFEEALSDDDAVDGQELSFMPASALTSRDYVAKARYLVGSHAENGSSATAADVRRVIAKLERATTELRQGLLNDDDVERKTQAEVLLNAYSRELERQRLLAGAQGLTITDEDDYHDDDDDDSEEEFHYPGAASTPTARPASIRSASTDYFNNRASSSRSVADLTPQLSQAPNFRVPTHDTPQKVTTPQWTAPSPYQLSAHWERDETVTQCRECQRRFTFMIRRHHCRRCGKIFCDRDSSYRANLDPSEVVHDPAHPVPTPSAGPQRVCISCYEQVTSRVPAGLQTRVASLERVVVSAERLSIPSSSRGQSSSQLSDLAECPVCNHNLDNFGTAAEQEAHVKHCLDGGSSSAPQAAKYLVYRLPAESTLISVECVICLEEFVKGSNVARLSCLCSFHNSCLSSWLSRGRSCPVHAR